MLSRLSKTAAHPMDSAHSMVERVTLIRVRPCWGAALKVQSPRVEPCNRYLNALATLANVKYHSGVGGVDGPAELRAGDVTPDIVTSPRPFPELRAIRWSRIMTTTSVDASAVL